MNPRDIEEEFAAFSERANVDLHEAPPTVGFDCMLKFYEHHRADGCSLDNDGDMLLFQWGVYDWGAGPMFEVDLTRQVILPDKTDDDAIWQLHLTYRYSPSSKLSALTEGKMWCHSPADLPDFRQFVRASSAVAAAADLTPVEVALHFECAG